MAATGEAPAGPGDVVDRALTARGYQDVTEATARTYAREMRRFTEWCRSRGFTAVPASSETMAMYARWLVTDGGRSAGTAEVALSAIRWYARISTAAQSVPDRVPAFHVLREAQGSRATRSARALRAACRADLAVVAAHTLARGDVAAVRDLLVVTVPFVLGVSERVAATLRCDHVRLEPDRVVVDVPLGGGVDRVRSVVFPCGHGQGQGDPGECVGCLLRRWWQALATAEAGPGRLLRPVDRYGRPAGAPGHVGGAEPGGGFHVETLARLARQVMGRAGLDEAVVLRAWWSLRLGGAVEQLRAGADLPRVAEHAGYKPGSATLGKLLAEALARFGV